MLRPVPQRRSPASLALAVLVHVAIGGIVIGLSLAIPQAPPLEPEPPDVFVHWPSGPPPPRGDGGGPRPPEQPIRRAPTEDSRDPSVVKEPQPEPVPPSESDDDGAADPAEPGTAGGDPGDGDGGDPNGIPDGRGTGTGGAGPDSAASQPGPSADEPMMLLSDMVMPRLIHRVEPELSPILRRAGMRGTVILRCIIGTSGGVSVVEVKTPKSPLDSAAIEGVEQWRYEPALWNGRPQAVYLTVKVTFR